MPSNRNLKSDDVAGFMLACWDSVRDLEEDYGVRLDISLIARPDRGNFTFLAVAWGDGDGPIELPVARCERQWPTHKAMSVHALLYSLLVGLWNELDVWRDGHHSWERASHERRPGE